MGEAVDADSRVAKITSEVRLPEGLDAESDYHLRSFTFPVTSKDGEIFQCGYFDIDPAQVQKNPGAEYPFNDTRLRQLFAKFVEAGAKAFQNYNSGGVQAYVVNKLNKPGRKSFAIAMDKEWNIASFQIYQAADLKGEFEGVKVLYLDQMGTQLDFGGRGIGSGVASEVFNHLSPDVLCTSSANAEMHGLARSVGRSHELVEYPTGKRFQAKFKVGQDMTCT